MDYQKIIFKPIFKTVACLLCIALFYGMYSCGEELSDQDVKKTNRQNVKSFINKVWNGKNIDAVDEFFSDSFARKVNNVEVSNNRTELMADIRVYLTGFPDLNLNINELIAFESKVYMSWTIKGTNTNIFGELPATGKKVTVNGISIFSFDEFGKIIHEDVYYNQLSFLQQLGYQLLPPQLE